MSEEAFTWLVLSTLIMALAFYSEYRKRVRLRERERILKEAFQRKQIEQAESARQADLLVQKKRLAAKRELIKKRFYFVRKKRQEAKQKAIEERKRQEEEQRLAEVAERKRILEAEHLEAKKRDEEERIAAALKRKQEEEKEAELRRMQNEKFQEDRAEFKKRLERLRAQLVCLEQITEKLNRFCPYDLHSQSIQFTKQSFDSLIDGTVFERKELGDPSSWRDIFFGSNIKKNRFSLSISKHVDHLLNLGTDKPNRSVFATSKEMSERGFPVNWKDHLCVLDKEFGSALSEIKLPIFCSVYMPNDLLPFDLSLPELRQEQYLQYWGKDDRYFDLDQNSVDDCVPHFPGSWAKFLASLHSVELVNEETSKFLDRVSESSDHGILKKHFTKAYDSNSNPLITLNSVDFIKDPTLRLRATFVIQNQSDCELVKKRAVKASEEIPGISKATKGSSATIFSEKETGDFVADSYRSLALRQLFLSAVFAKDTQVRVIEIALQTDWHDYATGKPIKGEVVHVSGRVDKILNINPQKLEAQACFKFFGGRITADVLRPTRLRRGSKSLVSEFPMLRIYDILGIPHSVGIELDELPYDDGLSAYTCVSAKFGKCLFHQLSTNRNVSKSEILALVAHGLEVEADNLFMIANEQPSAVAFELLEKNEIYLIDLSVGE